MERARDELFSHINRCGVLQAEDDDKKHWMDETIDYIGERYPDLTDGDLPEPRRVSTSRADESAQPPGPDVN